jgi:formylglycine-generating enzyme required for sulfatase activity
LFPLHRDGNLGFRLTVDTDGDRVDRGGSWVNSADNARAANRSWDDPGYRGSDLGFRLTVDNSPENTMTTKEMA